MNTGRLNKMAFIKPVEEVKSPALVPLVKENPTIMPGIVSKTFRVQSNRLTSVSETYLKTKGAFKIRVQNEGNVGIKIFGNFYLASYSDETFETGDASLSFNSDSPIEFDTALPTDDVNILLTTYTMVQ